MAFGLHCSVAMCSACSRAVGWVSHHTGFCHPAGAEAIVMQNGFPFQRNGKQIKSQSRAATATERAVPTPVSPLEGFI